MRVVLPLYGGGAAHLFVVFGYQGAGSDADKPALTDQLITSVLCEANVCCSAQTIISVGDLNAGPLVIHSLAKGTSDGGSQIAGSLHTSRFSLRLWMQRWKWPGFTLLFGLLVGYSAPIALGAHRLKRFRTFGMYIFRSSALCPLE